MYRDDTFGPIHFINKIAKSFDDIISYAELSKQVKLKVNEFAVYDHLVNGALIKNDIIEWGKANFFHSTDLTISVFKILLAIGDFDFLFKNKKKVLDLFVKENDTILGGYFESLIAGCYYYLEANNDEAVISFDKALKFKRKIYSKNSTILNGVFGLYHLFALIRSKRADNYKMAKRLSVLVITSRSDKSQYYSIFRIIHEILLQSSNEKYYCDSEIDESSPFIDFLQMYQRYLEDPDGEIDIVKIVKINKKAIRSSSLWISFEVSSLIKLLEDNGKIDRSNLDSNKIADIADINNLSESISV